MSIRHNEEVEHDWQEVSGDLHPSWPPSAETLAFFGDAAHQFDG